MFTAYKQRSIFIVIAFSMVMLLANSPSLFGLTSTTDTLFNIQGSIIDPASLVHLLQSIYAQEDDEEETNKSDDDNSDENEGTDNNDQENQDEDNRETNSIDLCCAWDDSIGDGELTYRIIEEEEDGDEALELKNAVRYAVKEWSTKIPTLKLVEVSSSSEENADIEVEFAEGSTSIIAGATMIRYDEDGFINKARITLPKAAFYVAYNSEIFAVQYNAQKLNEITIHEMTHALGVAHANFGGDIMSKRVNTEQEIVNISQCDIDAVLQANHWKLVANDDTPYNPAESHVNC